MKNWARIIAVMAIIAMALAYKVNSEPADSPTTSDASQDATVVRVSDGDTIVVTIGSNSRHQRVRLVGIDTPEVFGEMVECGAIDASADLKAQLPAGTSVRLVEDARQGSTDQYDRLLRYVETTDGVDLGRHQVLEGNAEIYRSASFDRSGSYRQAADEARAAKRGIWGTCG